MAYGLWRMGAPKINFKVERGEHATNVWPRLTTMVRTVNPHKQPKATVELFLRHAFIELRPRVSSMLNSSSMNQLPVVVDEETCLNHSPVADVEQQEKEQTRIRNFDSKYWSQSYTAQVFCQICGVVLLLYTCVSGTSLVRNSSFVQQRFADPPATLAQLFFAVPMLCAGTVAAYVVTRKGHQLGRHPCTKGEPDFDRFSILYLGIPALVFVFGSMHRHLGTVTRDNSCSLWLHLSNTLGVVAVSALSVLLVPVARHNVLFRLFGWNTAAAVRLHIGAGILVMVAVFGHVGIYVIRWGLRGEQFTSLLLPPFECIWRDRFPRDSFKSTDINCSQIEGGMECSCYNRWRNFWGAVAALAMVIIALIGLVRRRYYTVFYRVHVLAGPTMLLGAVLHWHRTSLYLAGGAIYYMACGLACPVEREKCEIQAVNIISGHSERSVVALVVAAGERFAPGQYVKLLAPQVSSVAHPFTANMTESGNLEILFHCSGSFTSKLKSHLMNGANLPDIFLDGMFGSSQRLRQVSSHDVSLVVAGGIGITPYLSLLADTALECPKVILHWVCRNQALIKYIQDNYLCRIHANVTVVIHQRSPTQRKESLVSSDLELGVVDDLQAKEIDSIRIQDLDNTESKLFAPARVSFLAFVATIWFGWWGLCVFHRNDVTAVFILPRIFGPMWVLALCFILRKRSFLNSLHKSENQDYCKSRRPLRGYGGQTLVAYRSCETKQALLNHRQVTIINSAVRPSLNNLLESIQFASAPGVFACGPPAMMQELRHGVERRNRLRTHRQKIALYEEVFDL